MTEPEDSWTNIKKMLDDSVPGVCSAAVDEFVHTFEFVIDRDSACGLNMFLILITRMMKTCPLSYRRQIWNLIYEIEERLDERFLDKENEYEEFISQTAYRVIELLDKE